MAMSDCLQELETLAGRKLTPDESERVGTEVQKLVDKYSGKAEAAFTDDILAAARQIL